MKGDEFKKHEGYCTDYAIIDGAKVFYCVRVQQHVGPHAYTRESHKYGAFTLLDVAETEATRIRTEDALPDEPPITRREVLDHAQRTLALSARLQALMALRDRCFDASGRIDETRLLVIDHAVLTAQNDLLDDLAADPMRKP